MARCDMMPLIPQDLYGTPTRKVLKRQINYKLLLNSQERGFYWVCLIFLAIFDALAIAVFAYLAPLTRVIRGSWQAAQRSLGCD